MVELAKYNKVCRFCLSHQNKDKEDVFHDIYQEKLVSDELSIRDTIESCIKIDLNMLDRYNVCCDNCLEKIRQVHAFVLECKRTSETLISIGAFEVSIIKNEKEGETDTKTFVCDNEGLENEDSLAFESTKEGQPTFCRYCKESFDSTNTLNEHISTHHPPDRPYTCPVCGKGFQSVSNRNTHIQSHNSNETYKCLKCQKSFRSKVYLSKHTKFVHSIAEHECKICNKTFINAAKYKYHARSHDTSKQFHCKYCDRSFIQIHHLQNHERTHTGQKPFLCTVCGQRFKVACNLKLHMKIHANDRKFTCAVCSKSFIQKSAYKVHMKGHEGVLKEFQCELCGKSFNQKSSLTVHLRIHTGEKRFECGKCDKRFTQRHQLTYHVKAMHEQVKVEGEIKSRKVDEDLQDKQKKSLPYICTICNKRFKVPSSLLAHTKIHSEDRKHACDQCNAKFKRREHLRIHVNGVHLKLKPFKCEICARTFAQAGDRNIHMKSHSEEKEHTCSICNKKFRLVKALRTHLRIHTGEKPYSCTFCKQSFMTYMAMAAHTEKCQAELTSGQLLQTIPDTSVEGSDKRITVITLPNTGHDIQSIEIPASIVVTVPIT